MKRFTITFSERVTNPKDPKFTLVSTEDYDTRVEVMKRFHQAIAMSVHAINSVNIVVEDSTRKLFKTGDEVIATYTMITE